LGKEEVLPQVAGQDSHPTLLVEDLLPEQTGHACHAVYPAGVSGQVDPGVCSSKPYLQFV